MASRIAALLSSLLLAGCSVVGIRSGTEEPAHTTLATIGAVEIRQYAPRIAATVTVAAGEEEARNLGFRKLAAYIFGANRTRASIAMTAPVAQSGETIAMTAPVAAAQAAPGAWTIAFTMPASFTLATLPTPDDADIHLVAQPAETYAVLRFTGSRDPAAIAVQQQRLLALLATTAWQPLGAPVAWFYDPPWTLPFLRRNEVAVRVKS